MNVLIASSDSLLRRRFATWLAAGNHTVVEADRASGLCNLLERKADVIVVDWCIGGGGGAALVRFLRTFDVQHRHYIIVVCAHARAADLSASFAAGADDFMQAPGTREELLARVDGLTRARSWGAAGRGRPSDVLLPVLERLRIWREIASIAAPEIGEMLGTPQLESQLVGQIRWCGTIALTLVAEQVELDFAIGLSREQTDQFSRELLGGIAGPDAIGDALREIANVAGGAIKRAALADGIAMTLGLPTNENIFTDPCVRTWLASTSSGLRFALAASATEARGQAVRCCELREGMVVASDVRNATGLLLVAAGTSLTATTVHHLARFLDANERIDISCRTPLTAVQEAVHEHA